MAFDSITIGSNTYRSTGNGTYNLNTLGFNSPKDGLRIIPGKKSNAKSPILATVQRFKEWDYTDASGRVTRLRASVSMQVSAPDMDPSYDVAQDLDNYISDLNTFVSKDVVNRVLMGES